MLSFFNSNLNKYFFYSLILFFIFSKELIVINEEFLIILSFLAVFFGLKANLSAVVEQELSDRTNQIRKQFLSLYENKQHFQNVLIVILEKKIDSYKNLESYYNSIENSIYILTENKKLINIEYLNIYTEQLLSNYLLRYNFELKNTYLDILSNINKDFYISE